MGMLPDGEEYADASVVSDETLIQASAPVDDGQGSEATTIRTALTDPASVEGKDWTLREVIVTPSFWILMLSSSSIWIATGAINLHQVAHMTDRGIPDAVAAGVLSVIAFIGFLGSIGMGLLQERIGGRWGMACLTFVLAIAMVLLINVHSVPMAYAYGTVYGISFSGLVVIERLIFAEYYGRQFLGSILGFVSPIQTVLGALSPIAAGFAYDFTGSYIAFFSTIAVSFALGAALMVFAPPPRQPRATA
jgi:MFS family permease